MGDKHVTDKSEPSPWDILQIDETDNSVKEVTPTDNIFFSQNKATKKNVDTSPLSSKFDFTGSKNTQPVKTDDDQESEVKQQFKSTKSVQKITAQLKSFKTNISTFKVAKQTKSAWLMIGIVSIFIAFFYWTISPASMIQKINVAGNTSLSKQEVIRATGIKVNRSIFGILMHENQISRYALKQNNQIKDVTIKVANPRTVDINVKEATRVGYILRDNKYYLILDGGQILPESLTVANLGLPIYEGFKHNFNFKNVLAKFATLDAPIRGAVSEIKYSPTKDDNQRIILYMNDGNQVNAKITTFADKMAYYPSIAAQMNQPGIVNLEVGAFSLSYAQIKQNEQLAAQKKQMAEAAKKAAKAKKDTPNKKADEKNEAQTNQQQDSSSASSVTPPAN